MNNISQLPEPASAAKLIKIPTSSGGALISVSIIVPSSEALKKLMVEKSSRNALTVQGNNS